MDKVMELNIITPDREIITEKVVSLMTTEDDGKIEILPNHAACIVATVPTVSTFTTEAGIKNSLFTSTGIVYVKNNVINFCCDSANYADEIDRVRAEEAIKRADKRIKEKDNIDIERAVRAIARANARLSLK